MHVGDVIRMGEKFWEVRTIALGVVGQESVVGLVPVGRARPFGDDGKALDQAYVPIVMVEALLASGQAQHMTAATRLAEARATGDEMAREAQRATDLLNRVRDRLRPTFHLTGTESLVEHCETLAKLVLAGPEKR